MVAKRKQGELGPASEQQEYEIGWEDLPLSCPTAAMKIWNAHPRVYIPIHRSGRESCTYCGATYILRDPEPDAPMPMYDNAEIEMAFRNAQARVRKDSGHAE